MKNSVAPEEENSFRNPFRLWKAREIFVVSGPFGDDLCVTLLIPSLNPNITFFSPKNKGQKKPFFPPAQYFPAGNSCAAGKNGLLTKGERPCKNESTQPRIDQKAKIRA